MRSRFHQFKKLPQFNNYTDWPWLKARLQHCTQAHQVRVLELIQKVEDSAETVLLEVYVPQETKAHFLEGSFGYRRGENYTLWSPQMAFEMLWNALEGLGESDQTNFFTAFYQSLERRFPVGHPRRKEILKACSLWAARSVTEAET